MIYAYIRVSTKQQKIDRQYEEIKVFDIDDKYIYIDKESGKDFIRTNYQKLIKKLKKGVKFGRPKTIIPSNVNEILDKYLNKELTNIEAAKMIGISGGTFFRLVKEYKIGKSFNN